MRVVDPLCSVEKTITHRTSYASTPRLFLFDQPPATERQFPSASLQRVDKSVGFGMSAVKLRNGTICLKRDGKRNGNDATSRVFVVESDVPHFAGGSALVLSPGERHADCSLRIRPPCLRGSKLRNDFDARRSLPAAQVTSPSKSMTLLAVSLSVVLLNTQSSVCSRRVSKSS